MMRIGVRLTNYEAMKAYLTKLDRVYRGAFSDQIKRILRILRNYAMAITHQETGTLAHSHTVSYSSHLLTGYIYPDPKHIQPSRARTLPGRSVQSYAHFEHARGGTHAFYERTYNEAAQDVVLRGLRAWVDGLPRGRIG